MFTDALRLPAALASLWRPYVFHPLTGLQVYLPHTRPFSWLADANTFYPETDIPDLSGKVVLVTGGSSGLGSESIYQILKRKPTKVFLAARSKTRADTIIERLRQDSFHNVGIIEFLQIDLADYKSVIQAARQILANTQRLDILLLNAGAIVSPCALNADGHDLTLSTNHLGHFLLVQLLTPLLEKTASSAQNSDVRVVVVASEAHNLAPSGFLEILEQPGKISELDEFQRYGLSKACNILFAAELARRLGDKNITAVSLHPGIVSTQLYESSKSGNLWLRAGLPALMRLLFDDAQHGALGQLFLATTCQKSSIVNGAYYTPVGRLQQTPLTTDRELAARLWSYSDTALRDYFQQ